MEEYYNNDDGSYLNNSQQNETHYYASPSNDYQGNSSSTLEEPDSIGTWLGRLVLMCIPVVNIIMLIIWAVSKDKRSRKNFAIAELIWTGIVSVLSFIFGAAIITACSALLSDFDVDDYSDDSSYYEDYDDDYDDYDYDYEYDGTMYEGEYLTDGFVSENNVVTVNGVKISLGEDTIGDVLDRFEVSNPDSINQSYGISVGFNTNDTYIMLESGSDTSIDSYRDATVTGISVSINSDVTMAYSDITEADTTDDVIAKYGEPTSGYADDNDDYSYDYISYDEESGAYFALSYDNGELTWFSVSMGY